MVNFFAHHWYLYTFHTYSYTRRASLPGPDFTFRHSEEYKSGVCVTHTHFYPRYRIAHLLRSSLLLLRAKVSSVEFYFYLCADIHHGASVLEEEKENE